MPSTITQAQRQFKDFTSGNRDAIHPSLRSAIFRIVISEGNESDYEAVKQEYSQTTSIDGKEICLQSLGRAQTPALAKDYLNFLFSDKVAVQDVHSGAASLAANPKARGVLWEYIKENWDTVNKKLSGNSIVLDRFLRLSLSKFASHEVEKDIAQFFSGKDNRGYDRSLGVISDTVRGNANYKERDGKLIMEWLSAHGYA